MYINSRFIGQNELFVQNIDHFKKKTKIDVVLSEKMNYLVDELSYPFIHQIL